MLPKHSKYKHWTSGDNDKSNMLKGRNNCEFLDRSFPPLDNVMLVLQKRKYARCTTATDIGIARSTAAR
jgi:hypothetical protein